MYIFSKECRICGAEIKLPGIEGNSFMRGRRERTQAPATDDRNDFPAILIRDPGKLHPYKQTHTMMERVKATTLSHLGTRVLYSSKFSADPAPDFTCEEGLGVIGCSMFFRYSLSSKIFLSPPPGLCLRLSSEPILLSALMSSFWCTI